MTVEQMTKWIANRQLAAMQGTLQNLRSALDTAEELRDFGEGDELYLRLEEMTGQVERMIVEQQGHIAGLE